VKGPATEVIESIGVKISFQNKYKTVQFCKIIEIVLDNSCRNGYNNQAVLALKASWIKPDDIGGREINV